MANHKIPDRQDALEKGRVHYKTSRPCVRGHLALRLTKSGDCTECKRIRQSSKSGAALDRHKKQKRSWEKLKYRTDVTYRARVISKTVAYDKRCTQATPKWADLERIDEVYRRCISWSYVTGIKCHVDHIVPLKGENVCGLHVHYNLHVMSARRNAAKGNSFSMKAEYCLTKGKRP